MIVGYLKEDLLSTPHKYIAHGCNMQHKMGKGIAKGVRDNFPLSYQKYLDTRLILGDIIICPEENRHSLIHCITQQYYGTDGKRYVSYDAVDTCFKTINNILASFGVDTLATSKVGASLGGGDWFVLSTIIDRATPQLNVIVYEGKPHA